MVHRQLDADQEGGAQRRHLGELFSLGRKANSDGERSDRGQDGYAQGLQAGDLAPDAEGGIAAGLVGDRALVEGVEAGVDCRPEHHGDRRERRRRGRTASASAP